MKFLEAHLTSRLALYRNKHIQQREGIPCNFGPIGGHLPLEGFTDYHSPKLVYRSVVVTPAHNNK